VAIVIPRPADSAILGRAISFLIVTINAVATSLLRVELSTHLGLHGENRITGQCSTVEANEYGSIAHQYRRVSAQDGWLLATQTAEMAVLSRVTLAGRKGERVMDEGIVKWSNSTKGYGFIGRPNGKRCLRAYGEIMSEGYKKLAEGDEVELEIVEGSNGRPQASKVVKLPPPKAD
jgi:CspA family cold shock protein